MNHTRLDVEVAVSVGNNQLYAFDFKVQATTIALDALFMDVKLD